MAHIDREHVLELCASLPGAELTFPFTETTSVFKVGGKMFALLGTDDAPGRVNLKVDPDEGSDLVRSHEAIEPGYHMNKRHWITVTLDGSLPDDFVEDLIESSYDLVVSALPKRLRPA
jgi:predicted DNA-binding protein (MmcQ/YjbR family)